MTRLKPSKHLTIKVLADDYLEYRTPSLSKRSQSEYRSKITNHIVPIFGDLLLSNLDDLIVEERLRSSGFDFEEQYSTIIRYLSVLESWAYWNHLVHEKKLKTTRQSRRHIPKRPTQCDITNNWQDGADYGINTSIEPFVDAYFAAENVSDPWGTILKIMLMTGQRENQVRSMRFHHYDDETRHWGFINHGEKFKRTHGIYITAQVEDLIRSKIGWSNIGCLFPSPTDECKPRARRSGVYTEFFRHTYWESVKDFRQHMEVVLRHNLQSTYEVAAMLDHRTRFASALDRSEYVSIAHMTRRPLQKWSELMTQGISEKQAELDAQKRREAEAEEVVLDPAP